MEMLWDLHFINGLFRPFQQSGYRAVPNGVTVIAQPAHALSAATRRKWKKRKAESLPLHFRAYCLGGLLSLGSHDLTTVVVAASLASSVGHDGFAALGANAHAGSRQLPVGTTTLVATGLGHFTLRDSHGDTSLVKLLLTAFINGFTFPEAASKQQIGDRAPSGNCRDRR